MMSKNRWPTAYSSLSRKCKLVRLRSMLKISTGVDKPVRNFRLMAHLLRRNTLKFHFRLSQRSESESIHHDRYVICYRHTNRQFERFHPTRSGSNRGLRFSACRIHAGGNQNPQSLRFEKEDAQLSRAQRKTAF